MKPVARVALGLVAAFGIIQVLPLGAHGPNPPVRAEPSWTSPEARALAVRACFDCHSNETKWPWYTSVAPVSWLTTHDVEEGRAALNFSEWDKPQKEADEAAEALLEGEMPMAIYLPLHPEARLTDSEKKTLADAFTVMFGGEHGGEGRDHD